MHEYLAVIAGLEKAAGDPYSAEADVQALALIGGDFALDPDSGWEPQVAGLKNGGVWAESSTAPGRRLLAGEDGNVTETLHLVIKGNGRPNLYANLTRLHRFIELAREHWSTFVQIEPVYLKWKALGAPWYQYALIYNIDAVIEYPDIQRQPLADVTLSIEREPYWRALPPGANPKIWSYQRRGEKYSYSNLDLSDTSGHWLSDSINNRHEWTATGANAYLLPLSRNYVPIPASLVPGDAPALVEAYIETTSGAADIGFEDIYIGHSLTDNRKVNTAGTDVANAPVLNCGDATVAVGAKTNDATLGVISNGSDTLAYYVASSVLNTYTTQTLLMTWQSVPALYSNLLRGSYVAILRARTTAGATGDVILQLTVTMDDQVITLPEVNARQTAGGTATYWLHYMGAFQLPLNRRSVSGTNGLGTLLGGAGDVAFKLYARNFIGTTRTLHTLDLFLLPNDNGLCKATIDDAGSAISRTTKALFDGTGYSSRGDLLDIATSPKGNQVVELQGNIPVLTPNADQRLYFLTSRNNSGSVESSARTNYNVRLNIIPRWRGIRDA